MAAKASSRKTLVGNIDRRVLDFTTGRDPVLDLELAEADCIGSAAHATMLSRLKAGGTPLISRADRDRVVAALVEIMREARAGRLRITRADQDIHLAVERLLTARLGEVGRRVHAARSRNDQVATDLRLYARTRLLDVLDEAAGLVKTLLTFARRYERTPMVGRTHMQPAMPSSVGLWASAHAETLLDDAALVMSAYDYNDRCPLGAAAGYGVPLPIDRRFTADLLGFAAPQHNVLCAVNARGKCETVILSAMLQIMLTLSRLAEDLIQFSTPEMPYFKIPEACTTGSSIMPQKRNPDVPELVRAKAARVLGHFTAAAATIKGLPSGYNRDLQEIKEPFMDGLHTTTGCLAVLRVLVGGLQADRRALKAGFSAAVFATDRALELVAGGMPFRDAYAQVKATLGDLETADPAAALAARRHLGAPAGLDLGELRARMGAVTAFAREERKQYYGTVSKLLGVKYPSLESM